MTSFAQYNNFKPHEDKMSESSLLSSPSMETIWKQHRIGFLFVAIVLTATFIFFVILILLKWFEAKRRQQELQPQELQQQQQQQPGSRDSFLEDDMERGVLLDTGALRDETGRTPQQLKPGESHHFVIVAGGRRWAIKLFDVMRAMISMPRREPNQEGVMGVDTTGGGFTTGKQ